MLAFTGQGVARMVPDYTGFGDPARTQGYFHAAIKAQMVLHGIAAAGDAMVAFPEVSHRPAKVFLAGYAQGGHAMFATADARGRSVPQISISGLIGYGPTRDVATLLREFSVAAPMLIHIFAEI